MPNIIMICCSPSSLPFLPIRHKLYLSKKNKNSRRNPFGGFPAGASLRFRILFLLLTGGEPLLFPDFKTLYRRLRNLGMILTINTNGTLLDEAWADFFATYPPRRINITLYGADAASYDRLDRKSVV